jgi:hypothetical protein
VRFNGNLSFLVLFVNIEVLLLGQLLLVILDLLSRQTYTRHTSIEKIIQLEGPLYMALLKSAEVERGPIERRSDNKSRLCFCAIWGAQDNLILKRFERPTFLVQLIVFFSDILVNRTRQTLKFLL